MQIVSNVSKNFAPFSPDSSFLRHFHQIIVTEKCTEQLFLSVFKSLKKPLTMSSFIHEASHKGYWVTKKQSLGVFTTISKAQRASSRFYFTLAKLLPLHNHSRKTYHGSAEKRMATGKHKMCILNNTNVNNAGTHLNTGCQPSSLQSPLPENRKCFLHIFFRHPQQTVQPYT